MAQLESELVRLTYNPVDPIEAAATRLDDATPEETLAWAFDEFGDRVAIATGFGAEGVALIHMAVRVNPRPNIFFLDTGFLFAETYELRRRIEDRYHVKIRAVQTTITPESQEEMFGPKLWSRDPDLCCRLRKLEPLKEELSNLDAWVTAIRRDQTEARRSARVVEWDHRWQVAKINPLVGWGKKDVWDFIVRNDVPYNPLHDAGYPSIGCEQCTRPILNGEDDRAGRWSGRAKTECGLHGDGPKLVPLKIQI
ncbi:MAG TPA: phosphoadenylyl-sulfate reductase [Blastocatellia bacterium]|nr:phosphoadenylyl-sulfate reductase [Blastocatellia bacterium]